LLNNCSNKLHYYILVLKSFLIL